MALGLFSKLGFSACAIVALATTQVNADTVSLTCDSVNPGLTSGLVLTFTGADNVAHTYNSGEAYVGLINWTVTGGNNPFGTSTISTYCIQGLQDIGVGGQYDYTPAYLTGTFTAPIGGQDEGFLNSTKVSEIQGIINYAGSLSPSYSSYSANAVDAALQLAIWRIEYGDKFTVSSTSATGDAADAVSLSQLAYDNRAFFDNTPVTSLVALTDSSAQDQIALLPGGGATPPSTPLPAALPAGLALMGTLAGARKLRRKPV